MTEKPTILLIPGAWHKGNTFEPVAKLLREQGYQAETITLPSVGGPASTTGYDDAEYIRDNYLHNLVTQGKEVIIVMHAYAGIPGTQCVQGFERKKIFLQGKQGGVVGLVYLAGFLFPAAASLDYFLPGWLDPMVRVEGGMLYPHEPKKRFYHDLDRETAKRYLAALVPHSPGVMDSMVMYEAYRYVPSHYIMCAQDRVLPMYMQEELADIPGTGIVKTYAINAGHFAMLRKPQAVANIIQEVAKGVSGLLTGI